MSRVKLQRLSFFITLCASFCVPAFASAATLSLSPADISIAAGDTITEVVTVASPDQAINAISGEIGFPSDKVEVVSISKANSVLTLWVEEPSFLNNDGVIRFSGVVPNPGYQGSGKRVFSITFRAKVEGDAPLQFTSSSVLANDGSGTNVLTDARQATIHITQSGTIPPPQVQTAESPAPHITSSTHPTEDAWYPLSTAQFQWTNDSAAEAVRVGYDKKKNGVPTVEYASLISQKELTLKDGTWYLHVQEKIAGTWGSVGTYRFRIDTESPKDLFVTLPEGTPTTNPSPEVRIKAHDDLSGVDHFNITLDGKDLGNKTEQDLSSKYTVTVEDPGDHRLDVTAYDAATNAAKVSVAFFVTGFEKPTLDPIADTEVGKNITVTGRALSNTSVAVRLTGPSNRVESATTTTDGLFTVSFPGTLAKGSYTATAQATNAEGAISYKSDVQNFTIYPKSLLSLSGAYLPWLLALILLILLILSLMRKQPHSFGDKKTDSLYKTHLLLRKEFSKLTEVMIEEISALERVTSKRALTAQEQRIIKRLKKMLEQAEKAVEKEIDSALEKQ